MNILLINGRSCDVDSVLVSKGVAKTGKKRNRELAGKEMGVWEE